MTVVVVMGVSGSGKTTVGTALAGAIGARFVDADDLHSADNVARMARGEPLTEADRAPWIAALRAAIDAWLDADDTVVLACSALTRRSRALLGVEREGIHVVLLNGPSDVIAARMRERAHFMPAVLLESQLAALEPPEGALELDVRMPVDVLVAQIKDHLDTLT